LKKRSKKLLPVWGRLDWHAWFGTPVVSMLAACAATVPAPLPEDDVVATVTVECVIKTDGYPTQCHVVSNTGAQKFADSTLA
jgi:hypothetical protein